MKSRSFDTNVHQTKLAVHDYSRSRTRTISKLKPNIRIIHIIAPEIIKTDVQNFRELVQKLTGKPAVELMKGSTANKAADNASSQVLPQKNTESDGTVPILQDTQTMKKEIEEIYEGDNPNAFLSFFADHVDGFLQDMNE